MSETVRIGHETYEELTRLAQELRIPRTEVLTRAVRELRRRVFFEGLKRTHAKATAQDRADDAAETAEWDATLSDGMRDEPWP